jgi:outer membrane protein assembly factor BamD (BamD/ComL family)
MGNGWNLFGKSASKNTPAPGPVDSLVLRGGELEQVKASVDPALNAELEGAIRLFNDKEYAKAETTFAKLANNSKNPVVIAEQACYYEAECQYRQGNYRKAEGTFRKQLKDFRNGRNQQMANRRLFDIANYWLDDTRKLMEAYEEKKEGKRWLVMPVSYVHFSKDKPFLDMEGHALKILEDVRLNDIGTPTKAGEISLGEKSLFYIATVKFFREDYRDADYYYSQLYENYPNSPLAAKAIKQAIVCKQIATGGTVYDGRSIEKARELADTASRAYKDLDDAWLNRQLVSIQLHQADRDFRIAEFYRRTGHPGSAYFYYELVRRRYPNTDYAPKATERMNDLRGRLLEQESRDQKLAEQPSQAGPDPGDGRPRLLPGLFGNKANKED